MITLERFFRNVWEACEDIDAQIPLPIVERCCKELYYCDGIDLQDITEVTYAGYKAIAEQLKNDYEVESALRFLDSI